MAFSQIPKEHEERLTSKFLSPLTLNMSMCQLQLGSGRKALSLIDSLENRQIKTSDQKIWNTIFKKGIVYDRMGDYDKAMYLSDF